VQMKKRTMKIGEAFVGMKRRGSQLEGQGVWLVWWICEREEGGRCRGIGCIPSKTEHAEVERISCG
jgi:pyruvate/2-oxoglutarate dehydrogenase complex dihydrolipoamide dehydrogenase (E3) component